MASTAPAAEDRAPQQQAPTQSSYSVPEAVVQDAVKEAMTVLGGGEEGQEDELDWEVDPEYLEFLKEKYKGEQYPLFMADEDIPHDLTSNPHLEALQLIQYDDQTPYETSLALKNQGNECFEEGQQKRERLFDALKCYTKALEAKCGDAALESTIYANRAHVNLILGRFVECVDDSRAALRLKPGSIKAAYRGAKASYLMKLFRQAVHFAERGLEAAPRDAQLLSLLKQSKMQLEEQQKKKEEEEDRRKTREQEDEEKRGKLKVQGILARRGVNVVESSGYDISSSSMRGAKIYCDKDEVVHWPTLMLFDEVMVSECVLDFSEDCSLADILKVMFAGDSFPEWDVKQQYKWDALSTYYEGADDTIYRVPLTDTLGSVIDRVKFVPGYPVFHVVVANSSVEESLLKTHSLGDV